MWRSGAEEARPEVRGAELNSELRNVTPQKADLKEAILGSPQIKLNTHVFYQPKVDNKLPKITFVIISCAVL